MDSENLPAVKQRGGLGVCLLRLSLSNVDSGYGKTKREIPLAKPSLMCNINTVNSRREDTQVPDEDSHIKVNGEGDKGFDELGMSRGVKGDAMKDNPQRLLVAKLGSQ